MYKTKFYKIHGDDLKTNNLLKTTYFQTRIFATVSINFCFSLYKQLG